MPKLKPISSEKLIKIVQHAGFKKTRQKGSHISFVHPDGRVLTIPSYAGKSIPRGLLNKIIKKDLKLTRKEFETYL